MIWKTLFFPALISLFPFQETQPPAPGKEVLSSITAGEVLEHVKLLSDDALAGRAAGSEGGRRAAEYIAERFRLYGLEPRGKDGSYFQPFEFPLRKDLHLGEKNRLERTGEGGAHLAVGEDWNPFSFSPATEAAGTLLFAGYGIVWKEEGYDDYAGVDPRGKVVLVLRHTPGESRAETAWKKMENQLGDLTLKAATAQEKGAAALIVVNDPNNHQGPEDRDRLVSFRRPFPKKGITIPCLFLRRAVADAWLKSAGTDLSTLQKKIDQSLSPHPLEAPSVSLSIATEVKEKDAENVSTSNVVGVAPGSDPALGEECVVIGAHYDHLGDGSFDSLGGEVGEIHNGADDNASGVAGLLEIAQAVAGGPRRPRRSVVFVAFGAEERGLIGSRHYVEDPPVPLPKTVAMINLDMIGRSEEGSLEVLGAGTSEGFRGDLERWNREVGLKLRVRRRWEEDSDHAPFADRKVPILFFFSGMHADYHRPGDDWQKINAPDAARIARIACLGVLDLAERPDRPAFSETSRDSRAPFLGIQVGGPRREGSGLNLTDVIAGAPAAVAGLLAGDAVLSIDGERIGSFEDLRRAIAGKKPGETVEIEIIRKVSVKLGERP